MFVKSSLEIPFGLSGVRVGLLACLDSWLRSEAGEAQALREELLAEVGLMVASCPQPLRLELGEATIEERMVTVPFRIWAEGSDGEWPYFHSLLSAAWFGEARTQLGLEARYVPPGDLPRRDQTLLHRVVEAVNRHVLAGVAGRLESSLAVSVGAAR